MKRLLVLFMVLVLMLAPATAFAGVDYLNEESAFPIVKNGEKKELSIATVVTNGVADMDDLWFWKWADEKLNIQFDVTVIEKSVMNEQISLMFVSGTMPDLLVGAALTPAQIVQFGQLEGQLMPLNDLIEAYAPNLSALFEKYPEYKGGSMAQDGNIYTLPTLSAASNRLANSPTVLVNTTWLEECGLEKPKTLDELYDTLVAFKQKYPESIPLGGGNSYSSPEQYIWSALGFATESAVMPGFHNGEVSILAGHELYGEYLKYMNRLYSEGLISKDFYTIDETQINGQLAEGSVGITAIKNYYGYAENWSEWVSVDPLTSTWNEEKVWLSSNTFKPGAAAISVNCKDPELAIRFLDTFYTVEYGGYLWNGPITDSEDAMGLVGGWYVNDAGEIIYAEAENGTYASGKEYLLAKVTPFNGDRPCLKPSNEDMLVLGSGGALTEYTYNLADPVDYYRASKEECVAPYFVTPYPTVYFDEETITRINEIYLVLSDYVATETAKFITGVNSLDQLDKYYEELKKLGIEEYEAYYADAYAVYTENLK